MAEKQFEQKIGVVIFATDAKGDLCQEDTSTLTIARGWVAVKVRRNYPKGSALIVYNKENGNQAEFVVDSAPAPNELKLLLRDQGVDIWQLDFGAPAAAASVPEYSEHLECARCHARESVTLTEEQINDMLGRGYLKRQCSRCMAETEWEEAAVVDVRAALTADGGPSPVVVAAAAPSSAPAAPPPSPEAEVSITDQLLYADKPKSDRRTARRIALKTRARIRRVHSAEIVQPINVSRGGVYFASRASYELDEVVWIALHYREGGEALETPGRVVRVERSDGTNPHRYGISFETA